MYAFNDNSFQFWNQLSSLKYLRSLEINFWIYSRSDNYINDKEFIIRSILSNGFCPLLESFIICTFIRPNWGSSISSVITTTKTTNIKYLSIGSLTFNNLIRLVPVLQNVKSFRMDYEPYFKNEFNEQHIMTIPLMPKCIRLHFKVLDNTTFDDVEYVLKMTPNLKDLFLWSWYYLLNAEKWEMLLSVRCPKLFKLELICLGEIGDRNFYQTRPFWIERNVAVTHEHFSHIDYHSDIVTQFNIKKVSFLQEEFH
jgi:hypothetical protein